MSYQRAEVQASLDVVSLGHSTRAGKPTLSAASPSAVLFAPQTCICTANLLTHAAGFFCETQAIFFLVWYGAERVFPDHLITWPVVSSLRG